MSGVKKEKNFGRNGLVAQDSRCVDKLSDSSLRNVPVKGMLPLV